MKKLLIRLLFRLLRVSDLQKVQGVTFTDADGNLWTIEGWTLDHQWDLRATITLREVQPLRRHLRSIGVAKETSQGTQL